MNDIDMLFWQAPTDGALALKRAVKLSEAAIQAAERGDEAEAEALLAEAEREALPAEAELERPVKTVDLAALAREAFRRLALTAAEWEEPLDADQYWVDRRTCRRVNRELARYNLRSFSRAPTAAEKRMFARPGYVVGRVEVQFDHGLWLRLPHYSRDYHSNRHSVRRLEHLHAVDTRIGLNWPTA